MAAVTPKKVIPIVKSWSFSRYSDYKTCPLMFKLKHLDKIQEPKNDAMARGAEIHEKAEAYIKGKLTRLPAELKAFADEFKKLRQLYKKKTVAMVVEDNWAFTREWDQTQWDNWTSCWVRIKLDCAHFDEEDILIVTDWKTGKFRSELNDDYLEQLELYALSALLLMDHIKEVRPRLAYLDADVVYPEPDKPLIYTRKDLPRLKKLWEKRVAPMFKDKVFAPRPNNKCRWCFYGQSGMAKGGPGKCKY